MKIAGSLIKNIHQDPIAQTIVKGVVAFAQTAGIQTMATFVHDAAVFEVVKSLQIHYIQGSYIADAQTIL